MIGDAVTQGQKTVGKVNVFKLDIRIGTGQLHIGEVPEAADAQIDQAVGGSLRHSLRDSQNDNVYGVTLDVGIQLVGRINGDAVDLRIDHFGRDVKGGVHGEAGVFKGKVIQQCAAQIADADHDEMVIVVHTQNVTDLGTELLNVVSISLLAKLAETTEILTDLRSGNIHFLPQRVRGGADNAAVIEIGQLPIIPRKPTNNGVRDIFFFHDLIHLL